MIFNVILKIFGSNFVIDSINDPLPSNEYYYSFQKDNLDVKTRLDILVSGNKETEISLKCFKYVPPPPRLKPCPEAGTIKIENVGSAIFDLHRDDEEKQQDYKIEISDQETFVNINLNFQ